jgi:hypothetical protein
MLMNKMIEAMTVRDQAGNVTSSRTLAGTTQYYNVLMQGCGHTEVRRMRPSTAGMAWTPEAVVLSDGSCAACRKAMGQG